MSDNTGKQLERAYKKFVGAKTDATKEKAKSDLRRLCEQYKVDLGEYIKDLPVEVRFNFKERVVKKPSSRRSAILDMVQEGIWDIPTLAEALNILNDNWPEPANRKAISGTLSDMRRHRKWIVDSCEGNRIVIREWI